MSVARPTAAAPSGVTPRQGFTVSQSIAMPIQPGPIVLQRAFRKYNCPVPTDVQAAAENGSVTALPVPYDSFYLSPVTVGQQTLNLDFDTGSADLWVFSSELPSSERAGHDYYDPSNSSTVQKLQGATWSITYGDGSGASGDVYLDTVDVGGTTVTAQAVELASHISKQFQQAQDNDGLLGLAFSKLNTVQPQQQKTFFDTAISQGVLSQHLFTADLKRGAPGSYDFGFIDESKYTDNITFTPVNSARGWWEFTGTGYAVGTGPVKPQSIDAIADTGTTLLLMDNAVVADYYSHVAGAKYDQGQGGYVFPCSADLPDFSLGIEEYLAVVPGAFLSFAPVDSSTCFGGLQGNSGLGFSIYGDIFLKAVFAVFDGDKPQIGFAPKQL